MAPQRPPTAHRPPAPAVDRGPDPLARPAAAAAPAAAPREAARRPAAHAAPAGPEGAPPPAAADELQLDPGTILLSLPVALGIGQLLIDQSLDALPRVLLWAGATAAWTAARRPGVAHGALDWLVDGLDLHPELRRRLGAPAPLPRAAAPPTRGAWGALDALAADVRRLQAAIRARRGAAAGALPAGRAGHPAWHEAGGPPAGAAGHAAVDALDDAAAEAAIGLPALRLEQIAACDNLWVVGPKGAGKTTLLGQLVALRGGRHWALDPHATPGKWPGCTVVGGGLAFDAIDRQLQEALGWMRARYQAQARGEVSEAQCRAARRTLVGDEWRAIRRALPEQRATRDAPAAPSAADRLLDILAQGRKAGICTVVASHADTAESMGVTGEKEILRCFDLVIYLGALATARVPAAARMARPAVVFDPERNAWAQLVVPAPQPAGAAAGAAASPAARPDPWPEPPATATDPRAEPGAARASHPDPAPDALLAALLAAQVARAADRPAGLPAAPPAPRPAGAGPHPSPAPPPLAPRPAPAPAAAATGQGHAAVTDTGHSHTTTARITVAPADGGGVTVNVNATAATGRRRGGGRPRLRGVNIRSMRRRAAALRRAEQRDSLAARYAARKAAGWSYRRAYADIGGNSDAARAAWRAAPGPAPAPAAGGGVPAAPAPPARRPTPVPTPPAVEER